MEHVVLSDIGQKRGSNEDSAAFFVNQSGISLAVVADGMGGHLGGDVASQLVVNQLGLAFRNTSYHEVNALQNWLTNTIVMINHHVLETANHNENLQGMGSTLVALILVAGQYIIANVGDSRCYLLRRHELFQITTDHSFVNELVKSGQITPEEAQHHPKKNIITRTIGVSATVNPDIIVGTWQEQDLFLLCSDGLTNMVSFQQLKAVLDAPMTLDKKGRHLIHAANVAGGLDNITAILVQQKVGDSAA